MLGVENGKVFTSRLGTALLLTVNTKKFERWGTLSYLDSGGNHMFIRVINMPIKLILLLIK